MLKQQVPQPEPADPREQLTLADELDARAAKVDIGGSRLRQQAVELRDAAWRQMGA